MKLPYDIIDIEIEKIFESDVITTSTIIPPTEDTDHDNGYIDEDEFV